MNNTRKSARRGRRDHRAPYQQSRAELAQQFTEEKVKPVNPVAELSNIMSKMKMKDEGTFEIPGLDLINDQKEEPTSKMSEDGGIAKH